MYATPLQRNRAWFTDRRAPDRRLQVTWHDEQRTTVLSIWHGNACAATFQLPVDESALLISHLANGLSHAFVDTPTARRRDSWVRRLQRALHRTR